EYTAGFVAREVVSECASYILRLRFSVSGARDNALARHRAFLKKAAVTASKLKALLGAKGGYADLRYQLDKLLSDADRFKPRRGAPADLSRQDLYDNLVLLLHRHGIEPSTARAGILARLIEQVHAAVGIPERDVQKAIRGALARTRKIRSNPAP